MYQTTDLREEKKIPLTNEWWCENYGHKLEEIEENREAMVCKRCKKVRVRRPYTPHLKMGRIIGIFNEDGIDKDVIEIWFKNITKYYMDMI